MLFFSHWPTGCVAAQQEQSLFSWWPLNYSWPAATLEASEWSNTTYQAANSPLWALTPLSLKTWPVCHQRTTDWVFFIIISGHFLCFSVIVLQLLTHFIYPFTEYRGRGSVLSSHTSTSVWQRHWVQKQHLETDSGPETEQESLYSSVNSRVLLLFHVTAVASSTSAGQQPQDQRA